MKLTLYPYQLRFKHPFKIAHGIRETTDVVYVRLTHESFTAWGEATLPPYLPETQKSVIEFLSGLDISAIHFPLNPTEIFKQINVQYPGNMSAKAALDMALWHLKAQMENKQIGELLGIEPIVKTAQQPTHPVLPDTLLFEKKRREQPMQTSASDLLKKSLVEEQFPLCTYTLGVSCFDEMKVKVNEALSYGFELFKIKLNGEDDITALANFRLLTDKPFAIDVNQGWKSVDDAIANVQAIEPFKPVLIEQPLPVALNHQMPALLQKFSIPFYADESCQTLKDVEQLPGCFTGVNIKLMKCGGISPALEMINKARALGLKILIGCMSESSVGCSAAAHLPRWQIMPIWTALI